MNIETERFSPLTKYFLSVVYKRVFARKIQNRIHFVENRLSFMIGSCFLIMCKYRML